MKRHAIIVQYAAVILMAAAAFALGAVRAHAQPSYPHHHGTGDAFHRVGLLDATAPPTKLRLLRPGQSVTFAHGRQGYNCQRGYFSDISAYQWNGIALAAQRWNADHTLAYWSDDRHEGGRVTFDGITFRNHLHRPALVAGWCE